ncbi:hypothetical protein PybrP1_001822 [[Pythium] brassicae (nom. inval.)]|nr:hypothetical protein PybrP1_001822 [[Pythium] brassicae (nom. inval.)]
MIDQSANAHHPRFLARTAGAMVMATAIPSAAAPSLSPRSSSSAAPPASNAAVSCGSSTLSRDDMIDLATISSLRLRERKREEELLPSPTDDDDEDDSADDVSERDDERKYELKIGFGPRSVTKPEPLPSTTSSASSHDRRDSGAAAAAVASSSARLQSRMRALASYLSTNIAGLRRRIAATNAGSVADVSRMRQYMQRRSAPSGSDCPKKLNVLSTRHSGSGLRTTLSWEDMWCDVDEADELMLTTPKSSRKRARPVDALQDAELRELCRDCGVHTQHVDRVVSCVTESFGTVELDMLVLEELIPEDIVVFVGMLVFRSLAFAAELVDLAALPQFFRHVQARYRRDMPFHNAAHAADVLHSLFMMLSTTALGDKIAPHNQVGALLAAVMHDIEHSGLTNDFLIKTNHPIAQDFPTRAPMESKHIAVALEVISNPVLNVLSKLSPAQHADVLTVVRETILATALCYQRELLDAVKAVPAAEWAVTEMIGDADALAMPLQLLALRCAMHVSDICQTMKPFAQHQKWVSRLSAEHFLQGKEDQRICAGVSPTFCFEESYSREEFLVHQTGFLQCLALPAVSTLSEIPWLDVQQFVGGVQNNLSEWTAERDM